MVLFLKVREDLGCTTPCVWLQEVSCQDNALSMGQWQLPFAGVTVTTPHSIEASSPVCMHNGYRFLSTIAIPQAVAGFFNNTVPMEV